MMSPNPERPKLKLLNPERPKKGPRMSKPRTSKNETRTSEVQKPRIPNVKSWETNTYNDNRIPNVRNICMCYIFGKHWVQGCLQTMFLGVWHANTITQIHIYSVNASTAIGEMALNPIKCYIFEKPPMQRYKRYFELSNIQIQNTNIQIYSVYINTIQMLAWHIDDIQYMQYMQYIQYTKYETCKIYKIYKICTHSIYAIYAIYKMYTKYTISMCTPIDINPPT